MADTEERREPMQKCHHCGRAGLVGSARVFTAGKAGTLFKCHNCQHKWEVPDEDDRGSPNPAKS
jgi:hypothetical protein